MCIRDSVSAIGDRGYYETVKGCLLSIQYSKPGDTGTWIIMQQGYYHENTNVSS